MDAFTFDHPATLTTPFARGTLRISAYRNTKGAVVTDSECGGWTMKGAKGIMDSSGDIHPIEDAAQTVANILSREAGATVTAADVKALWAKLA